MPFSKFNRSETANKQVELAHCPHAASRPWSVEEQDACFVVRDHNGQALTSQSCFWIESAELARTPLCPIKSESAAPVVACRVVGTSVAAIPICTALKNIECAQNLQVIMMWGQAGALLAFASVANL